MKGINVAKINKNISTKNLDNLAYFLNEIGLHNQAIKAYEEIFERDNQNCIALHNILYLLESTKSNDPHLTQYAFQWQLKCSGSQLN